jgi:flagellar biosynthetic protein FliR
MEFTESVVNQYLADFILPFTRIAALVMMMIGFGARTIPTRGKLFLCVALTFAIIPAIPPTHVEQL